MAAGGTAVGAAVALSHAPAAVSDSTTPPRVEPGPAAAPAGARTVPLDAAVQQVNELQSKIDDLRKQLIVEERTPLPKGTTSYVVQRVAVAGYTGPSYSPSETAALRAWQARLDSEQAQLAIDENRLVAEQTALASEKNALDAGAARLEEEQQQLSQEANRISSGPTSPPTTHGTTGASGITSAEGTDS
jgi:hypothetical protein